MCEVEQGHGAPSPRFLSPTLSVFRHLSADGMVSAAVSHSRTRAERIMLMAGDGARTTGPPHLQNEGRSGDCRWAGVVGLSRVLWTLRGADAAERQRALVDPTSAVTSLYISRTGIVPTRCVCVRSMYTHDDHVFKPLEPLRGGGGDLTWRDRPERERRR